MCLELSQLMMLAIDYRPKMKLGFMKEFAALVFPCKS